MNKPGLCAIVFLLLLFSPARAAEEIQPQNTTPAVKTSFKLYLLINGRQKQEKPRPAFAWRVLKAFPLAVKEYTFPAISCDYRSTEIRKASEDLLSLLPEKRQKNAVYIADEVYKFISENIEDSVISEKLSEEPHSLYLTAAQVLKEKKGSSLEKCRLAVSLLRGFTIPARIAGHGNSYAVEYFLKPMDAKGRWHVMDFTQSSAALSFPPDWNPVDKKELLAEEWEKQSLFIKPVTFVEVLFSDAEKAQKAFAEISEQGKSPTDYKWDDVEKDFYLIRVIEYELWLPEGQTEKVKVSFTMPFNKEADFKTIRFFLKPEGRLKVKYGRTHTTVNPPQEGIVYTLPAGFYYDK